MNKKLQPSDHVNLTEDIQRVIFSNNKQSSLQEESDFLVEAISSLEEKLGKEFTTEEIKIILETVVHLSETIAKEGEHWVVYDKKKRKRLGMHKTRSEAIRQLNAIEMNKS